MSFPGQQELEKQISETREEQRRVQQLQGSGYGSSSQEELRLRSQYRSSETWAEKVRLHEPLGDRRLGCKCGQGGGAAAGKQVAGNANGEVDLQSWALQPSIVLKGAGFLVNSQPRPSLRRCH